MTIIFNEKSLKNEIKSSEELFEEIKVIMKARQFLLKREIHIHCHRNFINYKFTNDKTILSYIMSFDKTERIDVMNWLSKTGPFWDDAQLHSSEDLYFHDDEAVSGTALAEAAAQIYCGEEYGVFSLKNERYSDREITITWRNNSCDLSFNIENYISKESLEDQVISSEKSIESWNQLERMARSVFLNIEFTEGCFVHLNKIPFYKAASKSIMEKLKVLDKIKSCFDVTGGFTQEGNELNQNHFIGDKAWFSDSSDTEKRDFSNEMTFKIKKDDNRLCPWHGKVKTPQIRIHFTYPIEHQSPLYIVYVGEKITKR
ncbi:hypothetical protein [Serratia sp. NPDC087055]|uniref:hypothetical protein n=1 Tax=Serratia sp. NPDC087055 TaxID=3364516 RepID=UPI00384DC804